MEDQLSDHALVTTALKGDREAFAVLVRRYQTAVHAFIVSRVHDFNAADDLAQETFVAAYLGLSDLREPERFAAWLRGIAANLSAAWLRRRMREVAVTSALPLDALDEMTGDEPSPEDVLLRREREAAALAALSRLTPKRAAAVALYYSDGLTYAECAEFLGVPVSTIEGRLHKARRQLQKEVLTMTEDTLKDRSPGPDFSEAVKHEIEELVGIAGGSGKLTPKQEALDKLELLFARNPTRLVEVVKDAQRLEDLQVAVNLAHRHGPEVVRTLLPLVLHIDETVRRNALAALPRDLDGTYVVLETIHDSDYVVEQRVELLLALLDRADEWRAMRDDECASPQRTPRQPKHVIEECAQHQQLYAEMLGLYEETAYPRLVSRLLTVSGRRRSVAFNGALVNALCRFGDRCLTTIIEFLDGGSEREVTLALQILQVFGRGWERSTTTPTLRGPDLILSVRHTGEVATGSPPIPPERVTGETLDAAAQAAARFLDNPNVELSVEAGAAVAALCRPCSQESLRKALCSPEPRVRAHAVRGLGRLGQVEDMERLVDALESDEGFVKAAAADELTRLSVDALHVSADALPYRTSPEARDRFLRIAEELDRLRPRILAALRSAHAQVGNKRLRAALSPRGFWRIDISEQATHLREMQKTRDRDSRSAAELAQEKRLAIIRGGEATPLFYVYLPAAVRALPEDREYHEVELTRLLSHVNYNYTLARRTLIAEEWMTRENNVYRFTEAGRRAWRMEKVLEQAARRLCGMADG